MSATDGTAASAPSSYFRTTINTLFSPFQTTNLLLEVVLGQKAASRVKTAGVITSVALAVLAAASLVIVSAYFAEASLYDYAVQAITLASPYIMFMWGKTVFAINVLAVSLLYAVEGIGGVFKNYVYDAAFTSFETGLLTLSGSSFVIGFLSTRDTQSLRKLTGLN